MMAADNLASYGSLARFRDIERLHKVTDFTVLGASGDMSDFQYVKHLLDSQMYVFSSSSSITTIVCEFHVLCAQGYR